MTGTWKVWILLGFVSGDCRRGLQETWCLGIGLDLIWFVSGNFYVSDDKKNLCEAWVPMYKIWGQNINYNTNIYRMIQIQWNTKNRTRNDEKKIIKLQWLIEILIFWDESIFLVFKAGPHCYPTGVKWWEKIRKKWLAENFDIFGPKLFLVLKAGPHQYWGHCIGWRVIQPSLLQSLRQEEWWGR